MSNLSPPNNPPQYSEKLLLRILNDAKDVQDLADIGKLYTSLAEAGDIEITQRILCLSRIRQQELIYWNGRGNKNN